MAARGPRILYEVTKLLFILNCAVTTTVCQEMVTQHQEMTHAQGSATTKPPANAVGGDYGGNADQFTSSLWSLLQTMDAFDTKQFDSRLEEVKSPNSTKIVQMNSTDDGQRNFKETGVQLASTTKYRSDTEIGKKSQGLHRDTPSIVQLIAPNKLSTSTIQYLPTTHNPNSISTKHSISNTEFEQEKTKQKFNESDVVTGTQTAESPSHAATEPQGQVSTIIPLVLTLDSPPPEASTVPFVRDPRKVDTTHGADESPPQLYPPHRRKISRVHPNHHQHHHYNPNVERTTQPTRNIMYVVMMQDRRCDGICCRRESYSGKCRLSVRCAVMHFHKTDMRKLTCGTSYHSLQVPVRDNRPLRPYTTTTQAFPGTPRSTAGTNVRKAPPDVNNTKEPAETSITAAPVIGTKSTQGLGSTDVPEVAVGNASIETFSVIDVEQTPVRGNGVRTFIISDDDPAVIGDSGVEDSDDANRESDAADSWTDHSPHKGTNDADVHGVLNDTEKSVLLTTEATNNNNNTESYPGIVVSTARMNQSGSVDYKTSTTTDVVNMDKTNKTFDIFDTAEDFGETFDDEEPDDGLFEFIDGEYFGSETDDGILHNETWVYSHNETEEDDAEFGEFDAYVTDEQSYIDYNDDDYAHYPEYQDDYHYHTDYVEREVDQATNGSPRHLVYTDQVWYGGTDLALGPRELSVQEEIQLSSPNNWHSFGGDGDAEWLNEENKRRPHLVLSAMTDRRPAKRV